MANYELEILDTLQALEKRGLEFEVVRYRREVVGDIEVPRLITPEGYVVGRTKILDYLAKL